MPTKKSQIISSEGSIDKEWLLSNDFFIRVPFKMRGSLEFAQDGGVLVRVCHQTQKSSASTSYPGWQRLRSEFGLKKHAG
jgi:hypothetical protein